MSSSEPIDSQQGAARASRFATTRWSQVVEAQGEETSESRRALGELCEIYWYPLYAFARRQGKSDSDAADLTQGFFSEFLRRELVTRADQERGRFRSYLLTAFKGYLSNEHRAEMTQKRGGNRTQFSINANVGESRYLNEPFHCQTPEAEYDRRWVITLLERVLSELEREYSERNRADHFATLKVFLTGDSVLTTYEAAAEQLKISVAAAKVATHRLRKRYRELLVREVRDTVSKEADVDDELQFLLSSLAHDSKNR